MEVPSDRNRLYLEGRRQGARRLSSDLHRPSQQSLRDVMQKTYVDLDWSDADDALP
jgi:hypothetical protein